MVHRDNTEFNEELTAAKDGETSSSSSRRTEKWLDIASTLLLSMAALTSSWAGYQSARWSGVQSASYSMASARGLESSRIATFAGLYQSIDLDLFMRWLDANMSGDEQRARFFQERFRPEFRPAFDAWLAAGPKENPAAPSTPFVMPEYRVERYERAGQLQAEAYAASDRARAANQQSDDYVFVTLAFSATLFFTGLASHLGSLRARAVTLAIATLMELVGLIKLAVYPVH